MAGGYKEFATMPITAAADERGRLPGEPPAFMHYECFSLITMPAARAHRGR
jgi:hypothetical protein